MRIGGEIMSKKEKLASVEECLARSDEIMINKRPSLLQRVNAGIILGANG